MSTTKRLLSWLGLAIYFLLSSTQATAQNCNFTSVGVLAAPVCSGTTADIIVVTQGADLSGPATIRYSLWLQGAIASQTYQTSANFNGPIPNPMSGIPEYTTMFSTEAGALNTAGPYLITILKITADVTGGTCSDTFSPGDKTGPLVVAPPPVASISGAASVAVGASTSFNLVGDPGGIWSVTGSAATVTSSGNVTGLSAGTATIVYTIATPCGTATSRQSITVTAPAINAGTISGGSTVCQGSTLQLSSNGDAGGAWTAIGTAASVNASGLVSGVAPGAATIVYTVSSGGNTASTTLAITVSPVMTVAAPSSPFFSVNTACAGATSITLLHQTTGVTGIGVPSGLPAGVTASFGSSGGISGVVITGVPTQAGSFNYSVPVTGGCGAVAASGLITVRSVSGGLIGMSANSAIVCSGSTVSFTNDGSEAGVDYQWQLNTGAGWENISGATNTQYSGKVSATSKYRRQASRDGCYAYSNELQVQVTSVNPGSIRASQAVCRGFAGVFTGTAVSGVAYQWQSALGGTWTNIAGATGQNFTVASALSTTDYRRMVTGTDGFACTAVSNTVRLTVNSLPAAATIAGSVTIVCASGKYEVRLTGSSLSKVHVVRIKDWSGEGTFYDVPLDAQGKGTIQETAENVTQNAVFIYKALYTINETGCFTESDILNPPQAIVNVVPKPTATITVPPPFCAGGGATLTVTGPPNGAAYILSRAVSENSVQGGHVVFFDGTGKAMIHVTNVRADSVYTVGLLSNYICDPVYPPVDAMTATLRLIQPPAIKSVTLSASMVCMGSTITATANEVLLSGGTATWISSNTAVAIIDANGVITGQGAGLATITYVITAGCGTSSATAVLRGPDPEPMTASAPSGKSSFCLNTPVSITHTTSRATGIGGATGLPPGLRASWVNNVITINGTVTSTSATGAFNYSIPLTGGCGGAIATGTIIINPAIQVTGVTVSQTDCSQPVSTVTAPRVGIRVYSLGGIWTSTSVFQNVPAGSYSLTATAQDQSTFCISQQSTVLVNPISMEPPSFSIIPPNCGFLTAGTISVTSARPGLNYSLTGWVTNSSGYFQVFPGNYTITASNEQCTSRGGAAVVRPYEPLSFKVFDETRNHNQTPNKNGEIQVLRVQGTGTSILKVGTQTWNLTGIGQSPTLVRNLAAGDYQISLTDQSTGCITIKNVTVKLTPEKLDYLVLSVDGSRVSAYEDNFQQYQQVAKFMWLSGTYSVTVINKGDAPAQDVVVNIVPEANYDRNTEKVVFTANSDWGKFEVLGTWGIPNPTFRVKLKNPLSAGQKASFELTVPTILVRKGWINCTFTVQSSLRPHPEAVNSVTVTH